MKYVNYKITNSDLENKCELFKVLSYEDFFGKEHIILEILNELLSIQTISSLVIIYEFVEISWNSFENLENTSKMLEGYLYKRIEMRESSYLQ